MNKIFLLILISLAQCFTVYTKDETILESRKIDSKKQKEEKDTRKESAKCKIEFPMLVHQDLKEEIAIRQSGELYMLDRLVLFGTMNTMNV